jgi:hypothetical protein
MGANNLKISYDPPRRTFLAIRSEPVGAGGLHNVRFEIQDFVLGAGRGPRRDSLDKPTSPEALISSVCLIYLVS